MVKCQKCNCSANDRPLLRTNPTGEPGIFWCDKCLQEHEPELYKNQVADMSPVEKDLIEMNYPKNGKNH